MMPGHGQVLFVDDDDDIRASTTQALELAGFHVRSFPAADRMLGEVNPRLTGAIITDIRMPRLDGMSFMQQIHEVDPDIPVILITGHGDVQLAVRAMRDGAYDFIEKPFSTAHLGEVVRKALDRRRLILENRSLRQGMEQGDTLDQRLVGRTPVMLALRERIRLIASTQADVLVHGPGGSGKKLAARALHDVSARSEKPFVTINCAALPDDSAVSEIFGHEVGAFPGAVRSRAGRLEHGRGGTIFLEDVTALSPELQAQLLQVLDERSFCRAGSNDPIELDARFIFSTSHNLDEEVARGRLRKDLLFRMNAVGIALPALSERRDDIPRLFLQLVSDAASRLRRPSPDVSGDLLAALSAREWPGNVRELRNWAERLVLGLETEAGELAAGLPGKLADRMAAFEKAVLMAELQASNGSLRTVYERLGLSRKTLYEKMQRHGLKREDFTSD
ncbi:MAG: sigma-54 dependent transcriptional regulator [Anderseniella sp.]|nr:sigma-54 dependent transcriptional regulator [Anderseniella sp.]